MDVTIHDWIQTATGLVTAGVAGLWAIYLFTVRRETCTNAVIRVELSDFSYGDHQRLLLVAITVRNEGKVRLNLCDERSYLLSVRELPEGHSPGSHPHWAEGRPIAEDIAEDIDVLTVANPGEGICCDGYFLEPGASYREVVTVVVGSDRLVIAKVCLKTAESTFLWSKRSHEDIFFEVHRTG